MTSETRPPITVDMTAAEFDRWYWPVDALRSFCEALSLSPAGTKVVLRARVLAALAGLPEPARPKRKAAGGFNWSKASLTADTVITDGISFGPNVRGYFRAVIGPKFSCHGDFMDWVRGNAGATLGDAVAAWHMLEARKDDPAFRREIAACNNYLQYLRDARDAHPDLSLEQAKACWDAKKVQPAPGGMVQFDSADLRCL